jgi:hypothetical protein
MTHRPFDDHTLCLLNAAIEFVERGGYKQRPDWKIILENRERKVIDSSVENKRAAVALSTPPTTLTSRTEKESLRG